MLVRSKLFTAIVMLGMTHASAANAVSGVPPAATCSVTIEKPLLGEKAGADVLVTGRAIVPPNAFLHIFSHRIGVRFLWPQGGGPAVIERGEFKVLAVLGEPRDTGSDFELIAQVVDAAENAKIDAWFKIAEQTGKYPGMQPPPFLAGCGEPARVSITKTK